MNFNEGAYIYINKPYRMSSFGALAHIRYVVSKRLKVKRVTEGEAGEDGACRYAGPSGDRCADPLYG